MDQQKKQKVILAVLGALALGAGGYYFVLREPAANNAQAKAAGPATRRERKVAAEPDRRAKRTVRETRARDKGGIESIVTTRRQSKKDNTKKAERRSRRGGKKSKTKKKEVAPAA